MENDAEEEPGCKYLEMVSISAFLYHLTTFKSLEKKSLVL
jgi:hypothetical protein